MIHTIKYNKNIPHKARIVQRNRGGRRKSNFICYVTKVSADQHYLHRRFETARYAFHRNVMISLLSRFDLYIMQLYKKKFSCIGVKPTVRQTSRSFRTAHPEAERIYGFILALLAVAGAKNKIANVGVHRISVVCSHLNDPADPAAQYINLCINCLPCLPCLLHLLYFAVVNNYIQSSYSFLVGVRPWRPWVMKMQKFWTTVRMRTR